MTNRGVSHRSLRPMGLGRRSLGLGARRCGLKSESILGRCMHPPLLRGFAAGAGIAWFALGPREVYVPPYPSV